jgi:hypothetical protein
MKEVIALISCSAKKKQSEKDVKAKELYQGELFKKTRRLMELRGQRWFILSALYGLLDPETLIPPYSLALGDLTTIARKEWAKTAADELASLLSLGEFVSVKTIEIYAGETYYEFLREELINKGYNVVLPLYALGGIGGQLHKLKIEIERLAPPVPPKKTKTQGNLY